MSKYEELEAFARTVEAGSFTAAAKQLGVAKSAVSRRIQDLEARLDTQLIVRTTRKLTLTDQGRAFFERARVLLCDWEETEAIVSQNQKSISGIIRISAPLSFGVSHLGPALIEFQQLHPAIHLDVDFTDRRVDLISEGIDVAIRIGHLPDSGLIARKIANIRTIAVASPDYISHHGMPQTPDDLKGLFELRYSLRNTHRWSYVSPDGVPGELEIPPKLSASNGEFLRDAAIAGMGVLLEPSFLLYDDIRAGKLVQILPEYSWDELGAYAVYPPIRHLSARIRAIVDHIAKHCGGQKPYWDDF
ncbi:LysR family transcriptional regulator [Hirschia litorea]|uniref:LysR substrate-binding domain-containing protein n=1 Tax=Hirschia litorea TaxID=1199156 RepID=A0ABW2II09_9PROT